MKKLLVTYVVYGFILLVGINVFNGCFNGVNEEEIMNDYIAKNYNEHCYGTLVDCDEEGCISFMVQEGGVTRCVATIDVDHYQD